MNDNEIREQATKIVDAQLDTSDQGSSLHYRQIISRFPELVPAEIESARLAAHKEIQSIEARIRANNNGQLFPMNLDDSRTMFEAREIRRNLRVQVVRHVRIELLTRKLSKRAASGRYSN